MKSYDEMTVIANQIRSHMAEASVSSQRVLLVTLLTCSTTKYNQQSNVSLHSVVTSSWFMMSKRSISVLIIICACLSSASGFCRTRTRTRIDETSLDSIWYRSNFALRSSPFGVSPKSVRETTVDEVRLGFLALTVAATVLGNAREASASDAMHSKILLSDEFEVTITGSYLGIGLTELEYRDKKNLRVCVQSVKDNADESVIRSVKPGMILVALNGLNVEGQSRSQVT